ncbi:MAG: patatin-like phospholipase family protein [Synergistales bacterium]|nr:patatin-like phospholipase family protein [Synergistales bacterium]MDY6401518.1 patatin-like phospholipase family protein [Synergistales bacterium]MDY6404625.1 patatin-like phospholipase family protein [Synergistales bacterium]MDY6410528.1 patatin-like phospholipase family protein [Synergistales bacterium]MDY6414667.1 patatin-like phospholipase family protein [Synergistales bacterium]
MKKFLCALIAAFTIIFNPVSSEAGVILVLSGGGTKGFAHLGVMETLEENGIPIIGIVGTSMGALMGALRASGYSTQDMHRILHELDLPALLSENTGPMFVFTGNDRRAKTSTIPALTYKKKDGQRGPKGILTGDKLYEYFSQLMRHVTETDFYHLPIPYAAVATDINKGEKVVLTSGNLAAAMRASMSIPALFEPWVIDDHLLVDGGVVSNLPVYTAKELFPNIPIVAVDISDNLSSAGINSYMDVVGRSLTILMRKATNEEARAADILLTPNIEGLGLLEASDPEKIIALGREAAIAKIEEIKALSDTGPGLFTLQAERKFSDTVAEIEVHGLPEKMAELVRKKMLVWVGKPVDTKRIDEYMEKLSTAPGVEFADYQLGRTNSGDILVRVDVRQSPELKWGISGYTTNLHPNRWLYLKGEARGLFSEYDSLIGVAKIGEQAGIDLSYQTAPQPMNAWQFTLSAQNWQPSGSGNTVRDWDRYAVGASRLFTWGDVNASIGVAYEHVDGVPVSKKDSTEAVGLTFSAEYDTLDIPGDPTRGYLWRVNAWWPGFDEINYRFSYFKPLEVSKSWRTYFRIGFAEGDLNKRSHAVYLGAAEELYSIARNPIEAERMFWTNLAVRKIISRTAMGVIAGEVFASWGYAMDKGWHKIDAPYEVGLAVNFPNNLVDMKFAVMYGSEDFKAGFFLGVPIWDHYPLP